MIRSSKSNCSLAVEFSLVKETILIQSECITQLYVIQSEQDPLLWFGVLFVDTGIYSGAIIRFNMIINDHYPDCPCPKIIFDPIPYHPLVDPDTGELDTKNAFPDWNSNTHKLHQLLLFVKRVIIQADIYIKQIQELINQARTIEPSDVASRGHDNNTDSSQARCQAKSQDSLHKMISQANIDVSHTFNDSVVSLFRRFDTTLNCIRTFEADPEEFNRRVAEFKQKSSHQLFEKPNNCNDDKNALIFSPWNPEVHEAVRTSILAGRLTPTSLYASYHKETESVSFVPGSEPI